MSNSGVSSACSTIFLASYQNKLKMDATFSLKNQLPLSVRFFMIAVLLFLSLFFAGRLNGTEQDVFRSDILTFHGDQRISADELTNDSFPVTLVRRTAAPSLTPQAYTIILRGIDHVERRLFQNAQNGDWGIFNLFRAALIAEGIRDPRLIDTYEARLNALVARVLATAREEGNITPRALTRSLFEAMHREILTGGYSLHCTELSNVMNTGSFNCVSATVLFNVLAEKAGLDARGLEMPGHALSMVKFTDGLAMKIETTAPNWFDLQTDQERHMATLQRVAPALAQANPQMAQDANAPPVVIAEADLPANLREINSVQLVATIYYNIGVDLHAKQRFPEAAAANLKALHLDRDNEQAWTNLLASLNNWALDFASESSGRRYDIATIILDQGVALDPTYANFQANQTYVFFCWIRGLAELGRFDDARRVYDSAQTRLPGNKALQELIGEVNQAELRIMQQRR